MNKESKKLSWAIGLVAGLGVLSIAYAALSSTLYINGSGSVNADTVEFTNCVPTKIGTNDTTSYTEGGVSGALVSGAYTGPYAYDSDLAKALGKAATGTVVLQTDSSGDVDGDYNADSSNADMQIWRSSNTSHHYGDSLTIKGTELYDYGTYVIYKATLTNKGPNKMKLVQVPKINAYFTPANGGSAEGAADANVKVTVHATEANATADNGTQLAAWQSGDTATNGNYLAPNGTCDWYIKVFRLTQTDAGTGAAGRLLNGTFRFTANVADTATGANPGVWVSAETAGA